MKQLVNACRKLVLFLKAEEALMELPTRSQARLRDITSKEAEQSTNAAACQDAEPRRNASEACSTKPEKQR